MADLTSKVISSNFQRLLQVDNHVVQDGTGSVTPLQLSGSKNVGIGVTPEDGLALKVQGSIKTSGDIIAENYIVSSSITYMTQSFSSGSNIFGDSFDDVHQFTGSLKGSGSVQGITIAGDISSSGDIYLGNSQPNILFTDSDVQIRRVSDDFRIRTNGATAMTVDDSRNVGIGTTDPTYRLDVESSEDTLASFVSTDNKAIVQIRDDDTIGYVSAENNALSLGANSGVNANNLNIRTDSYNVGIGTASPTRHLNLHTGSSGNVYFKMSNDTSGNTAGSDGFDFLYTGLNMSFINRENGRITFETNGTERVRILNDGGVNFVNDITASGDISASGNLTANQITASVGVSSIGTGSFAKLAIGDSTDGLQIYRRGDTAFIEGIDTDRNTFNTIQIAANGSTSSPNLHMTTAGNVGIATDDTPTTLTVGGHATIDNSITASLNISASGTLYGSDLSILPDNDVTAEIGRAKLHSSTTDYMYLSHFDNATNTNYALNQNSTGATSLNAKSGTKLSLKIANDEKLTVSADDVGIGTTTPDMKLHISSSDADILHLQRSTTGNSNIKYTNEYGSMYAGITGISNATVWGVGTSQDIGSSGVLIVSGANVGIGTTSPQTLLDVVSATGAKLRLGTSDTTVLDGDTIGRLEFYSADSNNTTSGLGAFIELVADGNQSHNNPNGNLNFGTSYASAEAATTRMTIDGEGLVGIGTTTPTHALTVTGHISSSGNTNFGNDSADKHTFVGNITGSGAISASGTLYGNNLTLALTGGPTLDIEGSSGDSFIRFKDGGTSKYSFGYDNGDDTLAIATGSGLSGNQSVTIDTDGNVGIGTTTPEKELTVAGDISSSGYFKSRDTYQATLYNGAGGGPQLMFGSVNDEDAYMNFQAAGGLNQIDTKDRDFHIVGTDTPTPDGLYFDQSTGKTGLGTSSPVSRLEVSSSTGPGAVHIDWSSTYAKGVVITPKKGVGGWARYYGFASESLAAGPYWGGFGGYGTHSGSFTRWFVGYFGSDNEIISFVSSSQNVGIGTTTPYVPLEVNSRNAHEPSIVAGDNTVANGKTSFAIEYVGNTDDYQNTIGNSYSSGHTVLGFAVKPHSGSKNTFVSSADNGAFGRGALVVGDELRYYQSTGSSTITLNESASMQLAFTISDITNYQARIGIGDIETPATNLHISSSNGQGIRLGGDSPRMEITEETDKFQFQVVGTDYSEKPIQIGRDDGNHNVSLIGDTIILSGSTAKVGINTDTPSELLEISASGTTAANILLESQGGDANFIFNTGVDGGVETEYIQFKDNGSIKWQVGKDTGNDFMIYDQGRNAPVLEAKDGDNLYLMTSNASHGNVAIGGGANAAPKELTVSGSISCSNDIFLESNNYLALNNSNNNNPSYIRNYGTNVSDISFLVGGSGVSNQMLKIQTAGITINSVSTKPENNALGVYGSIFASGSIGHTEEGHITASGNITASGTGSFRGGGFFQNNVGIGQSNVGTFIPSANLYVRGETGVYVRRSSTSNGNSIGMRFGVHSSDIVKSAIQHVRRSDNGVGDLQFWVDTSNDSNHVASADVKMTISGSGEVGIGTTTPSEKLEVAGVVSSTGSGAGFQIGRDGYDTFRFRQSTGTGLELYNSTDDNVELKVQNGKLGIGTNSPGKKLEVEGDISMSGDIYLGPINEGGNIKGRRDGTGNEGYINIGGSVTLASDGEIYFKETDASPDLATHMFSVNTGTANINTGSNEANDLGQKLYVKGGITTTSHISASGDISSSYTSTGSLGRVNSITGFFEAGSKISDYVFEPEYVLRTLPEVEQHISESKHLPGIPGEAEIEQWRNLSMGERDRLLLEKIEELTLYVISLQKQINELKDKN